MANGPSDDSAASSSAMPRVLRGLPSATGEPPVLDGFGDMGGTDGVATGQVGDGASDFQDAVPGAGRQIELRRGLAQQFTAGFVWLTAGIDFAGTQAGIGFLLAGLLPAQRGLDPGANGGRAFAVGLACQRIGWQRGNLDDQVDAVEERAGKLAAVAGDLIRRAAAFVVAMTMKSARAGIHCSDQLEFGRKFGVAGSAGDMDASAFERFAQGFQNFPVEFRQLVEKQEPR